MTSVEQVDISSVISLAESLWNRRSEDPEPIPVAGLEVDVQDITKKLTEGMRNGYPERFRSGTWPREDPKVGSVSIGCTTKDIIPPTFTITVSWSKYGSGWSLAVLQEIGMAKLRQVSITNQGQRANFIPPESTQS